jgi:hypothetical protein
MTPEVTVSIVAAGVAVFAAFVAGWQAWSASRSANASEAQASAARDQADAVREQVELARAAEARELARIEADAEVSKIAAVTMRKETRQPEGGSGAVAIIENGGPATAVELTVEVLATADGRASDVLATDDHRTDQRPELRPGERWQVPLMRDVRRKIPAEFSVRWRDGRGSHDERVRLEALGRETIR